MAASVLAAAGFMALFLLMVILRIHGSRLTGFRPSPVIPAGLTEPFRHQRAQPFCQSHPPPKEH